MDEQTAPVRAGQRSSPRRRRGLWGFVAGVAFGAVAVLAVAGVDGMLRETK